MSANEVGAYSFPRLQTYLTKTSLKYDILKYFFHSYFLLYADITVNFCNKFSLINLEYAIYSLAWNMVTFIDKYHIRIYILPSIYYLFFNSSILYTAWYTLQFLYRNKVIQTEHIDVWLITLNALKLKHFSTYFLHSALGHTKNRVQWKLRLCTYRCETPLGDKPQ